MRRLWLQIALILLVVVDLTFLPAALLGITATSMVNRHGTSAGSVAFVVAVAGALVAATVLVGRAWRRAPRHGTAANESE